MTDNRKLSLEQFTGKVGAEVPEFARALREENSYLRFCRKTREDLKRLRLEMGINQSEVAAKLQMSQPGVSKIENGEGDIGILTLCRYAGALGMQPTISFAPTAAAYMEQDRLKAMVQAIEKLSERRLARADSALHDRYRALSGISGKESEGAISASAMMGALASEISSAMAQSLSTEIASLMSALSDVEDAPAESGQDEDGDSHVASS